MWLLVGLVCGGKEATKEATRPQTFILFALGRII